MINLTTVKNSKRLTGELRQEAKDYIRKQFIQFKNKLGLIHRTFSTSVDPVI